MRISSFCTLYLGCVSSSKLPVVFYMEDGHLVRLLLKRLVPKSVAKLFSLRWLLKPKPKSLSCVCWFHYLDNADYDDDGGDLVDEDNDSWQAPAVTLVEQQKIYGIAQSTLNSLWGTCQRYAIRLGHSISILTHMECMEWSKAIQQTKVGNRLWDEIFQGECVNNTNFEYIEW